MGTIDRQRIAAVRVLEEMGYIWRDSAWVKPIAACDSAGAAAVPVTANLNVQNATTAKGFAEAREIGTQAMGSFVKFSGHVTWLDADKGYGFVECEDGLPRVLIHISCLRADGYETTHEGACIHGEATWVPKGLQAVHISRMDEGRAGQPQPVQSVRRVVPEAESAWEGAVVKWFNPMRGFGFLVQPDRAVVDAGALRDILVVMKVVHKAGLAGLRSGQAVNVRWGYGDVGRMAVELRSRE